MPDPSTEERSRLNFVVETDLQIPWPGRKELLFEIRSKELLLTSQLAQWYTSVEDELDPQKYLSRFVLQVEQAEALGWNLLKAAAESRLST